MPTEGSLAPDVTGDDESGEPEEAPNGGAPGDAGTPEATPGVAL
jgi:hypothetical protein